VSPCVGDIQSLLAVFGESPGHDKKITGLFTGQYENNRSSSPFYCLEVPLVKNDHYSNTYQLCKIRACKKMTKASIYILPPLAYEAPSPNIFSLTKTLLPQMVNCHQD